MKGGHYVSYVKR